MRPRPRILRSNQGSSLAELGPAMIVVTLVLIAVLGMIQFVNGAKMNDGAAAEAARVVAAGDPVNAYSRAQVVIDHANQQTTAWGCNFSLTSINFNPTNILVQEAKLVPNGGMLTGNVTIATQLTFSPLGPSGPPFMVNAQKSCPFSYNVPNTAGGVPVNSQ